MNLHTNLRYVGAKNYVRAYHDHEMWYAMQRTGILMVTSSRSWIVTQLGLALILNTGIKLLGLWRTLFYVAVVVPVVAKAYIWKAITARRWLSTACSARSAAAATSTGCSTTRRRR